MSEKNFYIVGVNLITTDWTIVEASTINEAANIAAEEFESVGQEVSEVLNVELLSEAED